MLGPLSGSPSLISTSRKYTQLFLLRAQFNVLGSKSHFGSTQTPQHQPVIPFSQLHFSVYLPLGPLTENRLLNRVSWVPTPTLRHLWEKVLFS